ncbi:MAG: NAD(P)/FAD-dependent oxidoreductase [Gammaproteobacteria bacterium]|nr:MAG: NAD(P)/FAD-dependent oxidoreductase [Gammaproteobacteria bacterium]
MSADPAQEVDVLVVGAGPGGTPAAQALAAAGRRVLLVEAGPGPGGTCLFEGCIPSKILLETARRLREQRQAEAFGLRLGGEATLDWAALQRRRQAILERRSRAALERLQALPTLRYRRARARLTGPRSALLLAEGGGAPEEVRFRQAILATGSEPVRPPLPGMDLEGVVDSDRWLTGGELPRRLAVIGGGPIGVELGQLMATFGTQVHLLERGPRLLGRMDEELALLLQKRLAADGLSIHTGCAVEGIQRRGAALVVRLGGGTPPAPQELEVDQVLVATGRRPRVRGLGLESTRARVGPRGIVVDEHLETEEPGLFAAGDVTGPPMFAHWATAQSLALAAHLLGRPAAFPDPARNTSVIFSHPELLTAGLSEAEAREAGLEVETLRYAYRGDARAQIAGEGLPGETEGLLKLVVKRGSGAVVRVHVLAAGASALAGEAAVLVGERLGVDRLARAIHPHPTWSESLVQAARAALARRTPAR